MMGNEGGEIRGSHAMESFEGPNKEFAMDAEIQWPRAIGHTPPPI